MSDAARPVDAQRDIVGLDGSSDLVTASVATCSICTQRLPQFPKSTLKQAVHTCQECAKKREAPKQPRLGFKLLKARTIHMLECSHCKKSKAILEFPKELWKRRNLDKQDDKEEETQTHYCQECLMDPLLAPKEPEPLVMCNGCGVEQDKSAFSRRQLRVTKEATRRCKECMASHRDSHVVKSDKSDAVV